ncbi:MAG: right-handed parallel beta-helix repeat-containing protein, partial [Bacteroidales bacterium]
KENWRPGEGWVYKRHVAYTNEDIDTNFKVWMYEFSGSEFMGYNPFGMMNILHDREYLQYQRVKMDAHFKRRGMIFVDGKPLTQVLRPIDLQNHPEGAFWPEHNGMKVHVRFPEGKEPGNCLAEATSKEQLFVPKNYGSAYIKIKSIHFSQTGNGFPIPQRGMISSNRGNHWIIENCTIEWANSLGIDLGNEMWHTIDQPDLGYHIIRGNIIRNCGISGLESLRAPGLLVEDNLFENIGWQDAELAFESGAIKFHRAHDCLIRRNVFRNISYAPGIWLDYQSNKNCRITQNVFSDIVTARGAIYIEVSRDLCRVDHNIFHKLRSQYWISGDYGAGGSALYTDGSDSIIFENNLAIDIENTGYGSYLNAERIVGMRGGITRYHKVLNNVFIDCKKHMIEFPNPQNFSDGNIFGNPKPGYLKIKENGSDLFLDLEAWRQLYGWEENGRIIKASADLNTDKLLLDLEFYTGDNLDKVKAGPFQKLKSLSKFNIDPRKLK